MEPSQPSSVVKTIMTDPDRVTFRTAVQNMDTSSLLKPVTNFERWRVLGSRYYPTYEQTADNDRNFMKVDDIYFRTANSSHSEITPDHAQIPGQDLCVACEDVNIRALFGRGNGRRYQLGEFDALLSCTHCSLCRLIVASLVANTGLSAAEISRSFPPSQVHLTSTPSVLPRSPQSEGHFEIRIDIIDNVTCQTPGVGILRLLADDADQISRLSTFKGRTIPVKRFDPALIQSWLQECDGSHARCRYSLPRRRLPNQVGAPQSLLSEKLLVVDVRQMCLAFVDRGSRYITLSYVWPHVESLKLTRERLQDFCSQGFLSNHIDELSNVLRDTLQLALSLSLTYVWIDALCIPQDDDATKHDLIQQMDRIYNESYLNIVVASSVDPKKDYRVPGWGSPRLDLQRVETVHGIRLVTALPDYNTALEKTRWATRGWTYQEGILSRRCLILTEVQAYFRCCEDSRCEDVTAEGMPTHYTHQPARTKSTDDKLEYLANATFVNSVSAGQKFREYARLVREFSGRSFSYQSDVLHGFSGIMNALALHFGDEGFINGMAVNSLERSLMWFPTTELVRRSSGPSKDGTMLPLYPSWSWAAWIGSVDFEADFEPVSDERLRFPMCLWHRAQNDALIPLRPTHPNDEKSKLSDAIMAAMYAKLDLLRDNPGFLVGWALTAQKNLLLPEQYIQTWLTDIWQTVPCFAIQDDDGHPCGFIVSTTREWADNYRRESQGEYELLLLSHEVKVKGDQLFHRARFFHDKYPIGKDKIASCFNVLLIQIDADGKSIRQGAGRIHKRALELDTLNSKVVILA